jgi:hypothetical protein
MKISEVKPACGLTMETSIPRIQIRVLSITVDVIPL